MIVRRRSPRLSAWLPARKPDRHDPDVQEEDVLVKSIELIKDLTGRAPRGYVAPWWKCRTRPPRCCLHGFKYDQPVADFQPFYARALAIWNTIDYSKQAKDWMHPLKHGKEIDLVDIAANWYVDDLPPMMFMKKAPNSHGFVNPRDIEELWRDQFDWVYREMDYAVFAFTIHPDVAGCPQVLLMLERLIEYISKHSGVEWMTFEDLAEDFRKRYPFDSGKRPEVIRCDPGRRVRPGAQSGRRGRPGAPTYQR